MVYVASVRSASRQIDEHGDEQPDRDGHGELTRAPELPRGDGVAQPKNTSTSFIASSESTATTSRTPPAAASADPPDAGVRLEQRGHEERDHGDQVAALQEQLGRALDQRQHLGEVQQEHVREAGDEQRERGAASAGRAA